MRLFARRLVLVVAYNIALYLVTWPSSGAAIGGWVSVWWLPAALAVAAVAAFGIRFVPVVYLGSIVYSLLHPVTSSWSGWNSIGIGVLLTAIYGATGLALRGWFDPLRATIRQMTAFLLITGAGSAVMGVAGVFFAQCVGDLGACPPPVSQVVAFAAGDGLAIVVFVPVLLGVAAPPLQRWTDLGPRRAQSPRLVAQESVWSRHGAGVELLGWLAATAVIGIGIEFVARETGISLVGLAFLPAFVVAARFGLLGAAVSVPVCSVITTVAGEALEVQSRAIEEQFEGGALATGTLIIGAIASQQVARLRERLAWEEQISRSIADARLLVYSQPIVDLASGQVCQEELLVRMVDPNNPDRVLPPADFLPEAERFGLMPMIDRFMVAKAVELAARGRDISVNVSAPSIETTVLTDEVTALPRAAPQAGPHLTFEVTETVALSMFPVAQSFTDRLAELGCGVALDDFGTGYGGLTELRSLKLRSLKIDRSFVRDLATSEEDQRIVKLVVHIASEFGLTTTAEGVEDEQALALLREFGVDRAQGFLLGRPAPVEP